jgi:hypothetical protein
MPGKERGHIQDIYRTHIPVNEEKKTLISTEKEKLNDNF